VLNGAPGSGINRQGKKIAQRFGWKISSIDKLLIELSKKDTLEGRRIKQDLEQGILPDSGVFSDFMQKALSPLDRQDGIVLIGYTWTEDHALATRRLLDTFNRNYVVFDVKVCEEVARKRVHEKAKKKPHRIGGGDLDDKLNQWMRNFNEFNPAAMKLFRLFGKAKTVHAGLSEEQAFKLITEYVSQKCRSPPHVGGLFVSAMLGA